MLKYRREFVEPTEFREEDLLYGRTIIACTRCCNIISFNDFLEIDVYEKYFKAIINENKVLKEKLSEYKRKYDKQSS